MFKLIGKNLSYRYQGAKEAILKDLNFCIESEKITAFIGKSGSGKTTLLKCLAGLTVPSEGVILWGNKPYSQMKRLERIQIIGYVSQQYPLFPHMTVLQNCLHPQMVVLKKSRSEAEIKTHVLLEKLNILNLESCYPSELSGGQQQRAAIVRALGMGPQVLLLDEPSSALDPESTRELADLFKELRGAGYTIVLTTHDLSFVKALSDHIILVHDGKILEAHKFRDLPKESLIYDLLFS